MPVAHPTANEGLRKRRGSRSGPDRDHSHRTKDEPKTRQAAAAARMGGDIQPHDTPSLSASMPPNVHVAMSAAPTRSNRGRFRAASSLGKKTNARPAPTSP